MTRDGFELYRRGSMVWVLLLLLDGTRLLAEPVPAAVNAFQAYAAAVESRMAQQHRSAAVFLAGGALADRDVAARLRAGAFVIERVTPGAAGVEGGLLHHWRGTGFAPGARAADFERLMRDFAAYPQHFAPQVLRAAATTGSDGRMQAMLRVRQRHVMTVVMDTTYDVEFGRLDRRHGYSLSRSTRVDEIEAAGTRAERTLGPTEEHGFLWRLNTYWSYEERDDGLYVQIEAVSLTRSVPRGLAWAIKPYIESIPRDSLDFTLRSACRALRP